MTHKKYRAVSLLCICLMLFSNLAHAQFFEQPKTFGGTEQVLRSSMEITTHIYGSVVYPGVYALKPGSRVTEVISMAKGLLQNGSQRKIQLKRQGKVIKLLDLVKLNLNGDLDQNPFVQSGDVIFVPFKEDVVSIQGPVQSPGQYEIAQEKNLFDVIHKLCGGFTVGLAKDKKITVIRFVDEVKKNIEVSLAEEELKSFMLQNGDTVYVPHKFNEGKVLDYTVSSFPNDNVAYPGRFNGVAVTGGVKLSKILDYNPYFKVPNYLALAGGLDRLAKNKVEIIRLDGSREKVSTSSNIVINPGDTIDVKQRQIAPEFWISFMATLASLGLSAYAILRK